jgi:hypothetical protein
MIVSLYRLQDIDGTCIGVDDFSGFRKDTFQKEIQILDLV